VAEKMKNENSSLKGSATTTLVEGIVLDSEKLLITDAPNVFLVSNRMNWRQQIIMLT
jgi:hypothetical protein